MITEELYFGYTPYSKYVAMNEADDSSTNKKLKDLDKKKSDNKRKINISAYFQNSFASELAAFMNKATPVDDIANVIKDKDEQIAAQAEAVIKATQALKKAEKEFEEMTNIASDELLLKDQEIQTISKQYAEEHANAERLRSENKQLKQGLKNDSSVNAATSQPNNLKPLEQEQELSQDSSTQPINLEKMEHGWTGMVKGNG